MNREELFIERMDELRTRLDSQKEYDILCAGNLIFQLILDRNKELANLVNTNEIDITYQIADSSEYSNHLKEMGFNQNSWVLDGLYPKHALVKHKLVNLSLQEFLDKEVIMREGNSYTIHQVIETVTKVMGARHAGEPWNEHETILSEETAKFGGAHATTRQILGIGNVVYDALLPLYEDVISR